MENVKNENKEDGVKEEDGVKKTSKADLTCALPVDKVGRTRKGGSVQVIQSSLKNSF